MSTIHNATLVQRYFEEGWNQGQIAVIDELFAPDCIYHLNSDIVIEGAEGVKKMLLATRPMFANLRFTVEAEVVEGDAIAARLTYGGTYVGGSTFFPETAKGKHIPLLRGLALFHLVDGKVAEVWHSSDRLSQYQQMDMQLAPVSAAV